MYLAVVVDESTGTSKTTTTLTTTLLRLLLVRCSDTTLKQYDVSYVRMSLSTYATLEGDPIAHRPTAPVRMPGRKIDLTEYESRSLQLYLQRSTTDINYLSESERRAALVKSRVKNRVTKSLLSRNRRVRLVALYCSVTEYFRTDSPTRKASEEGWLCSPSSSEESAENGHRVEDKIDVEKTGKKRCIASEDSSICLSSDFPCACGSATFCEINC
ncbi:hypothetical protein QR680_010957 [Steinernema hermaphroditum]|uniref:Uncharacterized protein n=1 Tax=Steinernema hermaphroditum TaxID=289476 RepID=A0AA39MC13_9BILA|nr:hypothetical protein QR680_010957 [Steinernema hermaphroditum]